MLTANINLNVPDLPDNDICFANNAAWSNYWANINISVTFDGANNTVYAESAFNNTLPFQAFEYNSIQYVLPTVDQFNSLLLAYQTLNTNYKALLTALKNAGIILN